MIKRYFGFCGFGFGLFLFLLVFFPFFPFFPLLAAAPVVKPAANPIINATTINGINIATAKSPGFDAIPPPPLLFPLVWEKWTDPPQFCWRVTPVTILSKKY